MNPFVIFNPAAQGGKAEKLWPKVQALLKNQLGPFEFALTTAQGEAESLAQTAREAGFNWFIVFGGDGTLSETVNGLFDPKQNKVAPLFSFLTLGTGGDYERSFSLAKDLPTKLHGIVNNPIQEVDIGRYRFIDWEGKESTRCFINAASFGMSGEVGKWVNEAKGSKLLGGTVVFYLSTLKALFAYPNPLISIKAEERELEFRSNSVALANGQFFGGGMWIAPKAKLNDGLLNVVCFGDVKPLDLILSTKKLYSGHIGEHPKVEEFTSKRLSAECKEREVRLEIDGENPGKLPATFWILPKAMRIKI